MSCVPEFNESKCKTNQMIPRKMKCHSMNTFNDYKKKKKKKKHI